MSAHVIHGNSLNELPYLEDCSVDAIVTDPPYELGFMNKKWDASGIAYNVNIWAHCLRVLKPGGHLLAFGGTRTYHRMACAIEDAGFEIRDSINWIYGSGFPKSLDVSKAIDKAAGAEREIIGERKLGGNAAQSTKEKGGTYASNTNSVGVEPISVPITAPATDAAKEWEGWGTALKPAHEPIVLARKPFEDTVANNVLAHGTGALNIDKTRIGEGGQGTWASPRGGIWKTDPDQKAELLSSTVGRWPANVIIDDSIEATWTPYFYCAKASKSEKNAGLDGMPEKRPDERTSTGMGTFEQKGVAKQANHHPTVKPLELMKYLCRLITPPNGTILDPFAGSGSTLVAATLEGFNSIGIEMTAEYIPIIQARLTWAESQIAS
jgi:site-specific DNA-methyltransferase (adenine-specific)